MSDLRRFPRSAPSAPVRVYDEISEQMIGWLGNISASGLMLISEAPLEEDLMLQIMLDLPSGDGAQRLRLGAQTLWCSPANVVGRYWTGLEIVDVSEQDLAVLRRLAASQ